MILLVTSLNHSTLLIRKTAYIVLFILGTSFISPQYSAGEYDIKLAFIDHFVQFIEWPEDASFKGKEHFVFGIYKENPFGQRLKELISNTTYKNKKVVFNLISKPEEIGQQDILFVSQEHYLEIHEIVEQSNNKPILTIGESKGAGNEGIMINFYKVDDQVRFEINESNLIQHNFKVSSRLLKLAKIVELND